MRSSKRIAAAATIGLMWYSVPPMRLRHSRACSTKASSPASIAPANAPMPL
jgi:hypothetical protein